MRRSIHLLIFFGCFVAALLFIATVNSAEEMAPASAARRRRGSSSSSSSESSEEVYRSRPKSKKHRRNRNKRPFQSFATNYTTEAVYKTKYSDKCPKDSTECQELCEEEELEKGWKVKGKCIGKGRECQCKEYTEESHNMGGKLKGPLGKFVKGFMDGF